jgi:hypothetical protein
MNTRIGGNAEISIPPFSGKFEKSLSRLTFIAVGTFFTTIVADILITFWALGNGYSEVNPVTAFFIYCNGISLWVIGRFSGAIILPICLLWLNKQNPIALKFSSFILSLFAASLGIIQFIGNFRALGIGT